MVLRVHIPLGTRYGCLVVAENDVRVPGGDGKLRWGCLLVCDCGMSATVRNGLIPSKAGYCSRSCGLRWIDKGRLNVNFGDPPGWYRSYNAMKQRCYTVKPGTRDYDNYRGRGIKVCARWLKDPMKFLQDMGERPEGQSIDRIDVNGHYEPANCKWATPKEQSANKRQRAT